MDFDRSTLKIELSEPTDTRLRDLTKTLDTLNGLYNYASILTVPDLKKNIEERLRTTLRKEPQAILYSSSLEQIVGPQGRVNVVSITHDSPIVITLSGISLVIHALAALLGVASPLFVLIRQLRKERDEKSKRKLEERILQLEVEKRELELEAAKREAREDQFDFLQKLSKMEIAQEHKDYIRKAVLRILRGLERNPIKPIVGGDLVQTTSTAS